MKYVVFNPITGGQIPCLDDAAAIKTVLEMQTLLLNTYPVHIVDQDIKSNGDVYWIASQLAIPSVTLTVTTTIPVTQP